MRVVLAFDSFTEFASADRVGWLVGEAMQELAREAGREVEIRSVPMADGGRGTVDVVRARRGGELRRVSVKDPLGVPTSGSYLVLDDGTALIEMAEASGVELLKDPEDRRQPFLASSFGTGELLLHAYSHGCRRLVLGLGGSATNDGGVGLAQALGVSLRLGPGELPERRLEGYGAAALLEAEGADFSRLLRMEAGELVAACDVDNPLVGPEGASAVYGPQKGATEEMIPVLDRALQRWADWVEAYLESEDPELGRELAARAAELGTGSRPRDLPGAGAAGGLGFCLLTLLRARRASGAAMVAELVELDRELADADLVVTGEGRVDGQSFRGKVVGEVTRRARRLAPRARIVAIGGQVRQAEVPPDAGIDRVIDTSGGVEMSRQEIRARGESNLIRAAREALDPLWSPRAQPEG